jgi:hypothetical protein
VLLSVLVYDILNIFFCYIEVHLLAHYIQEIKMHGETVKFIGVRMFVTTTLKMAPRCRKMYELTYITNGASRSAYVR